MLWLLLGQCVSFVALGVWWFLVFGGSWLVVFGALWCLVVGAGGNCNLDCSTVTVCRMWTVVVWYYGTVVL